MRLSTPLICASGALAATSGSDVEARQSESCAKLHIFGAREWLVPQGFGHESVLIEKIQEAYPGATSEAIVCEFPPALRPQLRSIDAADRIYAMGQPIADSRYTLRPRVPPRRRLPIVSNRRHPGGRRPGHHVRDAMSGQFHRHGGVLGGVADHGRCVLWGARRQQHGGDERTNPNGRRRTCQGARLHGRSAKYSGRAV